MTRCQIIAILTNVRLITLLSLVCFSCGTVKQVKIKTQGYSKLQTLAGIQLPERTVFFYFTVIDTKTEKSSTYLKTGNLEGLNELWTQPPADTDPLEHKNHYAIYLVLSKKTQRARDILQIHYSKLDKDYYFENIDSLRLLLQNS